MFEGNAGSQVRKPKKGCQLGHQGRARDRGGAEEKGKKECREEEGGGRGLQNSAKNVTM